jgi:hypothetical protein
MTELETQLLKIIEEQQQQLLQQQQLQQQQQSLDVMQKNYSSLISTIKGNGERTERLSANTKVISDNTDTISRARTKYSNLYRADQWQSQRDEPNYNELRGRTGENLNRTTFSLVRSSQSSAEFARNIRDIEANIVQMKERKKEMEQPQPKQDRGMSWEM